MNDRTSYMNTAARSHRLIVAAGCLLWCAGCSLAGDWRTVSVIPAPGDDMRVLSAISFAWDGRYTATERRSAEQTTSTGRYKWNGFRLKLMPEQGDPQEYPCMRSMDGSLAVRYPASVTATLRASD